MGRVRQQATGELPAGRAAWLAALIGLVAAWAGVAMPAWAAAERCAGETIAPVEAPPCEMPLLYAQSQDAAKGKSFAPLSPDAGVSALPAVRRGPSASLLRPRSRSASAPIAARALIDIAPKTSPPARAGELA